MMVRVSTEVACPLGVVIRIRPLVAPDAPIAEKGITRVVPLVEVTVTSLFLQNFTEIGEVVKPDPVMVNEPPLAKEIVVAERLVIVGAWLVSRIIDVSPFKAIVAPEPTCSEG